MLDQYLSWDEFEICSNIDLKIDGWSVEKNQEITQLADFTST